ncbi:MAG: class I SAM-dependent methyltransferase [Desulfuromonadales bacterium]|nr:class I SAM-dependent methyltransferase [Desulfuromonadales bacterium]
MFRKLFQRKKFTDSASYWEKRYAGGGTSGEGSYGELALFKADVLNDFVRRNNIRNVIEFGCGDGNQLQLAAYDAYLGFDVSLTAIEKCRNLFAHDSTKTFKPINEYSGEKAQLALSLDVIYHLVEDSVFEEYMSLLFGSSEEFIIIYSNDIDGGLGETKPHVRFRKFSTWVGQHALGWELKQKISNRFPEASTADFFIYEKK